MQKSRYPGEDLVEVPRPELIVMLRACLWLLAAISLLHWAFTVNGPIPIPPKSTTQHEPSKP